VRAHTLPATDFFHDTQEKNSKISTKRCIKRRTLSSVVIPTGPCFERTQTAATEIPFQRFGGNSGVSSEFVADATEDSFWRKPPQIGLVTRFQCVALHSTNCGRAWNDFFPDGKKKEKLQPGPTQPHAIDEVIVAPCESLQPRQRRHEYPLRRGVTEKKKASLKLPLLSLPRSALRAHSTAALNEGL
jgi:hypothetical protein